MGRGSRGIAAAATCRMNPFLPDNAFARSVRPLMAVATVALLAACATRQSVNTQADVSEIYKVFLDNWVGTGRVSLNVSIRAEAPSQEDIKDFSDCAHQGMPDYPRWLPAEPISDLT